jgi:thiol-disulfide isomerase/thioredoxin
MRHTHRVLAAGAALLLVLCTSPAAAREVARAPSPVPPQAAEFRLPALSGGELRLSQFQGQWVIVNFWATWCVPCLHEIPELIDFHDRHRERNAVVVGVNFEEIETAQLVEFVSAQNINYPIVQAGLEPLVPFEPLQGLPSTFFVDPGGRYVARHLGPITAVTIEATLERLRAAR